MNGITAFVLIRGGVALVSLIFAGGLATIGIIAHGGLSWHESTLLFVPLLVALGGAIPVLRGEWALHPRWVISLMLASAIGVSVSIFWIAIGLFGHILVAILAGAATAAFDILIALPTAPRSRPKDEGSGQDNGIFWS